MTRLYTWIFINATTVIKERGYNFEGEFKDEKNQNEVNKVLIQKSQNINQAMNLFKWYKILKKKLGFHSIGKWINYFIPLSPETVYNICGFNVNEDTNLMLQI